MATIKLLKGASYTHKNKIYMKGEVHNDVSPAVHKYLMGTGKFGGENDEVYTPKTNADIAKQAKGPRNRIKLGESVDEDKKAKKNNPAASTNPEGALVVKKFAVEEGVLDVELVAKIRAFRSKKEVLDIAKDEFSIDLESVKLKAMKEELLTTLTERAVAERTGVKPSDGPAITV